MTIYQGHEEIATATAFARERAQERPAAGRFQRWLCRISGGACYDEEVSYPGEGRHTYSRGLHAWGGAVHWRVGCNFYDIHCCRCCGLVLRRHVAYDPSYAPTEWWLMKGCPTNPLALKSWK